MKRYQLGIDDTGSVDGIYAFVYCTMRRSGQVLPMPDSLTDSQTLKDSATQLFIKYKSGALVTQLNAIRHRDPTLLGRTSLQIHSMSGVNKKPKKLKLSVMDFGHF